jgi:hypothetical protein
MSGVELEKPMELLYNYTLYGGIVTSPKGLNSEFLIPMRSQSSSTLVKHGKLPSELPIDCKALLITVYGVLLT